jgi:hypothetical protein
MMQVEPYTMTYDKETLKATEHDKLNIADSVGFNLFGRQQWRTIILSMPPSPELRATQYLHKYMYRVQQPSMMTNNNGTV